MASAIVDTNIVIELYRGDPTAATWFASQRELAITSITWYEIMEGARGKLGQQRNLLLLSQFGLEFPSVEDQRWSMTQLVRFRLSHGVTFTDCLIASVAHRLQLPVYTKNVKDFVVTLPASQVTKPY